VVHSGDFKVDASAAARATASRFERLGEPGLSRGVRARLVATRRTRMSEGRVRRRGRGQVTALERSSSRPRRSGVIVGLFASNVHRMRMPPRRGAPDGPQGRAAGPLDRHAPPHRDGALGLLPGSAAIVLVPARRSAHAACPRRPHHGARHREPRASRSAALSPPGRPANHPDLDDRRGGSWWSSARAIIPGNERPILDLIESLERRGIRVVHSAAWSPRIHVSGHAHREEQRSISSSGLKPSRLRAGARDLRAPARARRSSRASRGVPRGRAAR
jgi:hypothetical protein